MPDVAKREGDCIKNELMEIEGIQEDALINKNSSDGVVVGDLWGYISDVNEVIVNMFGANNKNELIGKHVLEFLVKEERAQAVQDSLNSIVNDRGMIQEYRAVSKSGKEVKLEVTTIYLRNNQGEKIGFINIVKNLSDR